MDAGSTCRYAGTCSAAGADRVASGPASSACASSYPAGWPDVVKSEQCPDLSGRYVNFAEHEFDGDFELRDRYRLDDHLRRPQTPEWDPLKVDEVELLRRADGAYDTAFHTTSGVEFKSTAPSFGDALGCDQGGLMEYRREGEERVSLFKEASVDTTELWFKATDGSLVRKYTEEETSINFEIWPRRMVSVLWERWLPVEIPPK